MSLVTGTAVTFNIGNEKISLDIKEKLGEGAFGTVTRAVDNRGTSFALKSIICKDNDTYESIARELDILLKLKHTYIVAMYGFDFLNNTAILVMEYCSSGTLNERLFYPVEVKIQLQWMEQLTTALTYLHNSNIVHRDLKTENVLLTDKNSVKLADFGVARHFVCCKRGNLNQDLNNYLSEYLDTVMGSFAGTPFWIAPEVFDNEYTEKADIFSLGVIFHAICERQFFTYDGKRYYGVFTKYNGRATGIGMAMYEQVQRIEPEFTETQNKNIKHSISSMLDFNPDSRISLIDLRVQISEAYCDVLQSEKPPIVIENRDDYVNGDGNLSKLLSSVCCWRYMSYQPVE